MTKKIKILIADDHNLLRNSLASVLNQQPHFKVIGEAVDGHSAVELALKLKPDVVLMDLSMPALNGLEAIKRIKSADPCRQIIVLSMHMKKEYVVEALLAGATSYLTKNCEPSTLFQAIERVSRGQSYFSPELPEDYYSDLVAGTKATKSPVALTDREREVLQLIAEGKRAKEIAAILAISPKTAENHRKNIMLKLGIHNITGLVQYAYEHGIVI